MRKKISNLKSRILLVLLSATIILTSFSLGVFAAPGDAQRAAEAQFWLNAMRHCISRSSNIVGYTGSELESGDIFMYTGGKSYYVGQYYEEQYGDHHFLGFGDDDGQMDCDESSSAIANAFAQSIGLENGVADLICDKYDNGRTGGLYVRQKMTDGHFTPNDQACSEFGSDTFLLADDAMEYLQKLYNEYVDNLDTSAAVRWEDINDVSEIEYFNSVSGYAMYKREFDKYCNGGEVRNQDYNVPEHWNTKLKVIDEATGDVREVMIANTTGHPNHYVKTFTGQSLTCDELIQKLNDFTDDYLAVIKDDLKRAKGANCAAVWENPALGDKRYSAVKDLERQYLDRGMSVPDDVRQLLRSYIAAEKQGWVDANGKCIDIDLGDDELNELTDELEEEANEQNDQLNLATFPTTADPQDQGLSELDICMSSAEGLGWIFCLIEDALARMTGEAYDKVVEPMLAVDSDFFATDGELYKAWDIFRNFANVFFVILLLIVILSQVTGFGIDNYGIKKIMPKLIITAILVNVSFFICSIAVDISNVLGSGLKDMLAGLGSDITLTSSGEGTGFMSGLVSTLVVIGIGGGIAAGTVAAIASPGILLSIVVALLGALLGIFFMLVSLGARMVGVILLTVISPLALVLYALPNTSKTFDKWFNAFKAILIVYPICGALIGGGQFAGRLIVGLVGADARPEGGMLAFFYIMLAMLMSVIPFFAIPSLLRNSLSALGNVGEKIRGFGSRATGAVTGAVNRGVRSTGAFQRAEGRAEMRKIDREAARGQRYINRHANDTGLAARMSRRRLGQAYAAVNKSRREGLSMEREGRTYDSWAATQAGIQAGYEEEDIKNQTALIEAGQYAGVDNINDINQLSNALSNAQTETEAAALKGVLEKVHGKNGMDAVAAAYTNTGNGMSDGARQRIARDIAKDSSYKTSARSVYDSATRTASSGAFSAPNLNTSAGNLKATDVPNLTSAEFSRIVGSFDNHGNYTGSQITSVEGARAAQAAVYEALQGDGMKDMKAEEIRAAKEFVRGYVPPDAVVDSRTETTASGGTINIRTTQDGRQIDDSGNIVNLR